jgi:hypothetical protein
MYAKVDLQKRHPTLVFNNSMKRARHLLADPWHCRSRPAASEPASRLAQLQPLLQPVALAPHRTSSSPNTCLPPPCPFPLSPLNRRTQNRSVPSHQQSNQMVCFNKSALRAHLALLAKNYWSAALRDSLPQAQCSPDPATCPYKASRWLLNPDLARLALSAPSTLAPPSSTSFSNSETRGQVSFFFSPPFHYGPEASFP